MTQPSPPPPEWTRFSWVVFIVIAAALLTRMGLVIALAFALSLVLALMTGALWTRLTPPQRARGFAPAVVMMLVPILIIAFSMLAATRGG